MRETILKIVKERQPICGFDISKVILRMKKGLKLDVIEYPPNLKHNEVAKLNARVSNYLHDLHSKGIIDFKEESSQSPSPRKMWSVV